ncbi:MAG: alpha-L-fucosidase 2 [Acidobacteriaceae bacterium]|jgi:hypothetical protein|nr:alpha-L-fucosidase 2 [Acidobacteriaceae bacterium]
MRSQRFTPVKLSQFNRLWRRTPRIRKVNDPRTTNRMRLIPIFAVLSLAFGVAGSTKAAFGAAAQEPVVRPTTAWRDGKFNIDVRGVVARSSIVLQRPNLQREESMPPGNGRLGLGVWSQECFTAQLNRQDTLPKRLSPGQLVIPALCKLSNAADFTGRPTVGWPLWSLVNTNTSACGGNQCCLLSLESALSCLLGL